MDDRVIWASGHGAILLLGLLGLTFASGYWALLIALLPTAYLLVFFPFDPDNSPKTVVASHLTALITGWMIYSLLAHGISPIGIEPMSEAGFRIIGSALLTLLGLLAIFSVFHIQHSMAYVTATTAAIGVFPTAQAFIAVSLAILFMASLQTLRRKLGPKIDSTAGILVGGRSNTSNRQ